MKRFSSYWSVALTLASLLWLLPGSNANASVPSPYPDGIEGIQGCPAFTINQTGTSPGCEGDVTLSVPTNIGQVYQWFLNGNVVNGATSSSFNPAQSGTYNCQITDTSAACSDTATAPVTVTIYPKPTAAIGPTDTADICPGSSFIFDAMGPNIAAYLWSTGQTSSDITVNTAGTYTVVVYSFDGCTDTASAVLTVTPQQLIDLPTDTSFCSGESVFINGTGPYVSWQWSDLSTDTALTVTQGGAYAVTVTNAAGCSSADTIQVIENPLPVVTLSDSADCDGTVFTLDAGAGYTSYTWSEGSTSQSISVTTGGPYFVQVTDTNGCTNMSNTANITVYPLPVPPSIDYDGNQNVLVTGTYTTYQWSYNANNAPAAGDTLSGANGQTYMGAADGPPFGYYIVAITDANGCAAVSPAYLHVLEISADGISEGFSPNGDSNNDTWYIDRMTAAAFPNNMVRVFNRYGNQVFEAAPYDNNSNNWNGTWDGKPLPDGTYFYTVDPGNGQEVLTGFVVLKR